MDIKSIFLSTLLGGIIGVSASTFIINKKVEFLQASMKTSHPVAVVDFVALVSNSDDSPTEESISTLMLKTSEAVQRYKDEGYIVIDSRYVISAHESAFLQKGDLE